MVRYFVRTSSGTCCDLAGHSPCVGIPYSLLRRQVDSFSRSSLARRRFDRRLIKQGLPAFAGNGHNRLLDQQLTFTPLVDSVPPYTMR